MELVVETQLLCKEGLRTLSGILPKEHFKIKKRFWPSLMLVEVEGELIPCRFYSEDNFSRHCWKSGRPENLLSGSDTVLTCLKCQLDEEAEPRKFKECASLLEIGIILPELKKSEIKAKFAWYRDHATGEVEVKDEASIPN